MTSSPHFVTSSPPTPLLLLTLILLTTSVKVSFCKQLPFHPLQSLNPPVPIPSLADPPTSLDVTPHNTAVLAGDNVTLSCSISANLTLYRAQWWEFITIATGNFISDNLFLSAHPQRDRYTLIHDTDNQYDLQISDVRLADGGTYQCQEALENPPQPAYTQLVVLGDTLQDSCMATLSATGEVTESQYITIDCYQSYQGNAAPSIEWIVPQAYTLLGTSTTPTTVWSGISLLISRVVEGQVISALLGFKDGDFPPADALDYSPDNTPGYTSQYNSSALTVYWGPQNLYIDPVKPTYQVGDEITCYADAKPAATLALLNLRTNEETDGAVFSVGAALAGTTQTVRCAAHNVFLGDTRTTVLDFTVTVA